MGGMVGECPVGSRSLAYCVYLWIGARLVAAPRCGGAGAAVFSAGVWVLLGGVTLLMGLCWECFGHGTIPSERGPCLSPPRSFGTSGSLLVRAPPYIPI